MSDHPLHRAAAADIGGILLLKKNVQAQGARWFGKVSTVLFYATMLVIVLWYDALVVSAPWVLYVLVGLVGVSMLIAFVGYLQMFLRFRQDADKTPTPEKG